MSRTQMKENLRAGVRTFLFMTLVSVMLFAYVFITSVTSGQRLLAILIGVLCALLTFTCTVATVLFRTASAKQLLTIREYP